MIAFYDTEGNKIELDGEWVLDLSSKTLSKGTYTVPLPETLFTQPPSFTPRQLHELFEKVRGRRPRPL